MRFTNLIPVLLLSISTVGVNAGQPTPASVTGSDSILEPAPDETGAIVGQTPETCCDPGIVIADPCYSETCLLRFRRSVSVDIEAIALRPAVREVAVIETERRVVLRRRFWLRRLLY